MLNNKIKNYLKDNEEIKLLPEYQEKFKNILINYGIDEQSAFCELMSNYSGEFSGSEGTIMNVANDLSYGNDSYEFSLHEKGLPKKYLQLLTSEYDDYLLYNIENDSVILILGANDIKLQHGEFDKEWDSFNDFLEDFFEIE